jgi:hypothetical protein
MPLDFFMNRLKLQFSTYLHLSHMIEYADKHTRILRKHEFLENIETLIFFMGYA